MKKKFLKDEFRGEYTDQNMNNITQQYEKINDIELRKLHKRPDTRAVLRYKKCVWTGRVRRSDGLTKAVLNLNPNGKKCL